LAKVTVYSFRLVINGESESLPMKVLRERIRTLSNAEEIPGTGEEIDESMLDANGFYWPKA
jgi:hypothetical protein